MTIEEWAAEMWRRGRTDGSCVNCSALETCQSLKKNKRDVSPALCWYIVAALTEAGVVPVVKAPGEKKERTETK